MAIVNPTYEDFKNNQEHALDYREYRSTYDVLRASSLYFKVATQSEDYDNITNAIGSGLVTTAWHEDAGNGEELHIRVSKGICIVDNQAILFKDDFEFIYDLPAQTTTYDVYIRYKFILEYDPNQAIIEIIQEPNNPDPNEYLLIGKVTVDPSAVDPIDPNSGIVIDLSVRSSLLADVHIIQSSNIIGGSENTIVYQTSADHTGFINAPTAADQVLKWDGNTFVWENITHVNSADYATCASTLVGGDSNQIVYQIAADQTDYIATPINAETYLKWDGTTFVWSNRIEYSNNISGGDTNQIPYQTAPDTTNFIAAPTTSETYLKWNGTDFVWESVNITDVNHAICADTLLGGDSNQIVYQTSIDQTSFISAPTTSETYLKWDGSVFVWDSEIDRAKNISGGVANQILYQTATDNTGFIAAPTDPDQYLTWDGTQFVWKFVSVESTIYACHIKGGASYQILYQSNTDQTGFINAPTVANRVLTWDGTSFVWNNEITYASYIKGGGSNQILYQNDTNVTDFIDAPAIAGTYLKWDGTTFVWDIPDTSGNSDLAQCAVNLAGGAAYEIPYQTNTDSTDFISAPTTTSYLYWNSSSSAFEWKSIADESVRYADCAGTLTLNGSCQLIVQDGATTTLINAPSSANSYLKWDGTTYIWEAASGSVTLAECANNLNNGAANQIPYQTGAASTSFINAPTVANTVLKWDGSAFVWSSSISCAYNLAGGNSNQIPYQTNANSTSFINAPSTANTFLKWDGSAFVWSTVDINVANDIAGGSANQILYQRASNDTDFIAAPTAANTYLKWSGSSFIWYDISYETVSAAECANNIAGGNSNQIPYQIAVDSTGFIAAPNTADQSRRQYLYYDFDDSTFKWTLASNSSKTRGVLDVNVQDTNNYRAGLFYTTGQYAPINPIGNTVDEMLNNVSSTVAVTGGSDAGIGVMGLGTAGVVGASTYDNINSTYSLVRTGVFGTGDKTFGVSAYSPYYSALHSYSLSNDRYASIIDGNVYGESIVTHSNAGISLCVVNKGGGTAAYFNSYNSTCDMICALAVVDGKSVIHATNYSAYDDGGAYCTAAIYGVGQRLGAHFRAVSTSAIGFGVAGIACCYIGVYGFSHSANYGATVGVLDDNSNSAAAIYGRHESSGVGVCGYTATGSAAVSGNTPYAQTSDTYYKFKNKICIQECLRCCGFPEYSKYMYSDEINKGFSEYIGPTAQSIENIFGISNNVIEYTLPFNIVCNIRPPKEPEPPKKYTKTYEHEIDKYTLKELKEFKNYEKQYECYMCENKKYGEIKNNYEYNPIKISVKSMPTVDGIALALATENYKCILKQDEEIAQLKQEIENLKTQLNTIINNNT